MINKLGRMLIKRGGKWQAAEQAETAAQLAEGAFGWDSLVTGEAYKELGSRCGSITDWAKAASAFKRARDAFEAVNGNKCRKALSCTKALTKAVENQQRDMQNMNERVASMGDGANGNTAASNVPRRKAKGQPQTDAFEDDDDENNNLNYANESANEDGGGLDGVGGGVLDDIDGGWNDDMAMGVEGEGEGGLGLGLGLDGGSDASALTASPNNTPPGSPPNGSGGIDSYLPGMLAP